ncbi:hypothetical protein FAGKG844_200054 [Frankia sp. AgKG'84/4]
MTHPNPPANPAARRSMSGLSLPPATGNVFHTTRGVVDVPDEVTMNTIPRPEYGGK